MNKETIIKKTTEEIVVDSVVFTKSIETSDGLPKEKIRFTCPDCNLNLAVGSIGYGFDYSTIINCNCSCWFIKSSGFLSVERSINPIW